MRFGFLGHNGAGKSTTLKSLTSIIEPTSVKIYFDGLDLAQHRTEIKQANLDNLVDVDEEKYNLIDRDAEQESFAYLKEHNISFVPFFPLASGLLTGKYTKATTFPANDIRHDDPDFQGATFEKIIDGIDEIRPIAEKYDATVAQIVIAWYIKNPNISVVIPGAKKPEQVKSNVKALNINLTDAEYQLIDEKL